MVLLAIRRGRKIITKYKKMLILNETGSKLHHYSCYEHVNTHTFLLTPWCRVLLEKLTGLQLVKKFLAFLWNPKVHYRTHKRPPPVPILGQPNPVHIPTSHLLEIHPNIIHPSTPRSPQWSLSLRFPHQQLIRPPLLTHTRHMPSPSHSSRFYHPHNIGWGVQIIKLLVMQSPPFPRYLVPPRSKYSQHPIFKHPQLPFLSQCQCPSFTPIQNNWQNYSSIYLNL